MRYAMGASRTWFNIIKSEEHTKGRRIDIPKRIFACHRLRCKSGSASIASVIPDPLTSDKEPHRFSQSFATPHSTMSPKVLRVNSNLASIFQVSNWEDVHQVVPRIMLAKETTVTPGIPQARQSIGRPNALFRSISRNSSEK